MNYTPTSPRPSQEENAPTDQVEQFLADLVSKLSTFGDGSRRRKVARTTSAASNNNGGETVAPAEKPVEKPPEKAVIPPFVLHPAVGTMRSIVEDFFSSVTNTDSVTGDAFAKVCYKLGSLTRSTAKNAILAVATYQDRWSCSDEYLDGLSRHLVDPVLEACLPNVCGPSTWDFFKQWAVSTCELWIASFLPYVLTAWKEAAFNDCILLAPHSMTIQRTPEEIAAEAEKWRHGHAQTVILWSSKVDRRRDTVAIVPEKWLCQWLLYAREAGKAPPPPILASDLLLFDGEKLCLADSLVSLPEHVFAALWKCFGGAKVTVQANCGTVPPDASDKIQQLRDIRPDIWNIELRGSISSASRKGGADDDDDRSMVPLRVTAPAGTSDDDLMVRAAGELQRILATGGLDGAIGGFEEATQWIEELLLVKNIVSIPCDDPKTKLWEYRAPLKPNSYHYSYSPPESQHRGICGLNNLGNTCYMNSALQVLSNSTLFRRALLGTPLSGVLPPDSYPVAAALVDVLRDLWAGGVTSVSPKQLKFEMGIRVSRFSGYEQHDSIDFLHCLFDKMHNELNSVVRKSYRERKDEDREIPQAELSRLFWDDFKANDMSIVTDTFYGQYRTLVHCRTCSNVSVAFENEMNLSVPINKKSLTPVTVHLLEVDLEGEVPLRRTTAQVRVASDATVEEMTKGLKEVLQLDDSLELAVTDSSYATTYFSDPGSAALSLYGAVKKYYAYVVQQPPNIAPEIPQEEAVDTEDPTSSTPTQSPSTKRKECLRLTVSMKEKFGAESVLVIKVPQSWSEGQLVTYIEGLAASMFRTTDAVVSVNGGYYYTPISATSKEPITRTSVYNVELREGLLKRSIANVTHSSAQDTSSASMLTLEECLEDMNKTHVLSGDDQWYCGQCKKHQDAEISFMIHRLPPVLLVHLKRFKNTGSIYGTTKIDTPVNFPLVFDMSRFVASDEELPASSPRSPIWYALRGVIYHGGSLEGGHYTAVAFSTAANSWASFNDSHAAVHSSAPEVRGAYILLYEAISNPNELPAAYGFSKEGKDTSCSAGGEESQSKKAKHE